MLAPGEFLFIVFLVWLVCGVVAASVGPAGYSGRLFWLTFLFMGPMGIAAALIMRTIQDFAPKQPEPPAPAQTPPPRPPRQSPRAKSTGKQPPDSLAAAKRDELKEADAAAAKAEAEVAAARARLEQVRRRIGRTDTSTET